VKKLLFKRRQELQLSKQIINGLKDIAGKERVLTSREDLLCYSFDGTPLRKSMPEIVVLPETTQEISRICKLAADERFFIVPRGAGTSLSGGAVPLKGGVVLSMAKFNAIPDIDVENLTITVQPGVVTEEINKAVEKYGLFYPPDPASMKVSTIGGNIAENSGGLRGLKYGVTENYILGLEVVLSNGDIINTGVKAVKNVAGYNLNKLFIGSEGTLGIVTKALLKLIPLPECKKTLLVHFEKLTHAASVVSQIIASKIIPATLEFLDNMTIRCVEDYSKIGLSVETGALLLIEIDGNKSMVEEQTHKVIDICKNGNSTQVDIAGNEEEALQLTEARRSAFPALARQKPTTILEDVTVPRSRLAEMVEAINTIAAKYDITIGTFGHIGDGNLHPTCITDERDKDELKRVKKAFDEIFTAAINMGGTISGEHGVGISKKKYLEQMVGPAGINAMKRVKTIFDPDGILNPGKIFL